MPSRPSPDSHPLTAATPIGVLVVDDQKAVRDGIAQLIRCAPLTFREICTAASGADALTIANILKPDVVILDADLHGEDGLELIGQFGPGARVLVLTSQDDAATRERAMSCGAKAFMNKKEPANEILAVMIDLATTQKN